MKGKEVNNKLQSICCSKKCRKTCAKGQKVVLVIVEAKDFPTDFVESFGKKYARGVQGVTCDWNCFVEHKDEALQYGKLKL